MRWRSPPPSQEKPIPEVGLTTFRPPYTPVTFGSFAGPARGDLFDPDPPDPDARLGSGARSRVRGRGPMEARLVFPEGRRVDARGGRARMPHDAQRRRRVRRHHARQDRGRRAGRGCLSRADVRQRLPEARDRPLPLRPDAERGRLPHGRRRDRAPGARPLPRHDHDGRRAARAGPHGGLSPNRVHRPRGLADFDDRAMGGDRGSGAEGARDDRAAHRRRRSRQRGLSAHERPRSAACAAFRRG